jgi:hypothetical protein
LLLANLPTIKKPLEDGCVVVFDGARLRVRRIPVGGGASPRQSLLCERILDWARRIT